MARKAPTRFNGDRRISHERAGPASTRLVDCHPEIDGKGDKHSMAYAGVLRRRDPTNPYLASKFTNMVFDYSNQLPVVPDTDPRVAVEASQKTGETPYRTMNRNGHPFAMVGNFVGGSPDDAGNPFGKPRALKDMK